MQPEKLLRVQTFATLSDLLYCSWPTHLQHWATLNFLELDKIPQDMDPATKELGGEPQSMGTFVSQGKSCPVRNMGFPSLWTVPSCRALWTQSESAE